MVEAGSCDREIELSGELVRELVTSVEVEFIALDEESVELGEEVVGPEESSDEDVVDIVKVEEKVTLEISPFSSRVDRISECEV